MRLPSPSAFARPWMLALASAAIFTLGLFALALALALAFAPGSAFAFGPLIHNAEAVASGSL